MKETNKSVEQKTRDITNKSDEKAQAEVDKTAAEEAREAAMNEQQQNKNEEADLYLAFPLAARRAGEESISLRSQLNISKINYSPKIPQL